jgi:hypothetical protein
MNFNNDFLQKKKSALGVFQRVHVSQAIVCLAMCSDDCRVLGWGFVGLVVKIDGV